MLSFVSRPTIVLTLASCVGLIPTPLMAQDWAQFGAGPARRSAAASTVPPAVGTLRWSLSQHNGQSVTFPEGSGTVAAAGTIYAVGKLGTADTLLAVDGANGVVLWTAPVPAPIFDSFSTPAVDAANGVVIVTAENAVRAFHIGSGTPAWTSTLDTDIVDASPCITTDRPGSNRLLITDSDFAGAGKLYCINTDPFDPGTNPHQPGEILWSIVIGSTSGNTPSYALGRVYVTCAEGPAGPPGATMCFTLTDTAPTAPLWRTDNPAGQDYFGGVSIASTPTSTTAYVASYGFSGGQLAGDLAAINADTGTVLWHSPCNRTDSTPVPLADGRIVLSGGVEGFGSVPSLELFSASGTLLWDTALATWNDANLNGQIDPGEYLRLGGWASQPALIPVSNSLVSGDPGAAARTVLLNLSVAPTSPLFIIASTPGFNATPAIAAAPYAMTAFATGPLGLVALGAPACYPNCDASTFAPYLNVNDFACFLNRFAVGDPYANCDGSTLAPVLNVNDFVCFLNRFAAGCTG